MDAGRERGQSVACCARRDISLKVAMAVIKMAHSEGHLGSAQAARALEA